MLKNLIDQFYLDRQKYREQKHFYITDAGKCGRAIFFKFKNIPREEMEARVLRLFEHGDYIQMQILNIMFSLGIVRASEIDIPPQEIVSGRADAIVTLNNELYVVDFKSMNSLIFGRLTEAKEEHINQIQLYMHFFKIPRGILLYVSKDSLELKEFYVDYDKKKNQMLLKELTDLRRKIDSNILPKRLGDFPNNWQCRFCQFKEICNLAEEKEMSWEKFRERLEVQERINTGGRGIT